MPAVSDNPLKHDSTYAKLSEAVCHDLSATIALHDFLLDRGQNDEAELVRQLQSLKRYAETPETAQTEHRQLLAAAGRLFLPEKNETGSDWLQRLGAVRCKYDKPFYCPWGQCVVCVAAGRFRGIRGYTRAHPPYYYSDRESLIPFSHRRLRTIRRYAQHGRSPWYAAFIVPQQDAMPVLMAWGLRHIAAHLVDRIRSQMREDGILRQLIPPVAVDNVDPKPG